MEAYDIDLSTSSLIYKGIPEKDDFTVLRFYGKDEKTLDHTITDTEWNSYITLAQLLFNSEEIEKAIIEASLYDAMLDPHPVAE